MNELSKLLIKLRGAESGRKAAKRAGISHNYLAILEKGFDPQTKAPINPSPETLMSLATAYDYPYEELMKAAGYLFNNKNEEINKSTINETEMERMKREIREIVSRARTEEDVKSVLHVIKKALKE